jgi:hypothetical protein
MAAFIVNLARLRPTPAAMPTAPDPAQNNAPARLHFWPGASGRRYAHALYSLITCPPLPPATYLLVRCDAEGRRKVLHVGLANSLAPTLNLARVRQRGATLGANEVHVHFLAANGEQRRHAAADLRAAQPRPAGCEVGPSAALFKA